LSVGRQLIAGWGRAAPSAASVVRPRSVAEVEALIGGHGPAEGQLRIARGLGRSYGDAAQCAGGMVLDCTALDSILEIDGKGHRLRALAGVSLDTLLRRLVPRGYFVPVSPGTRFVTLGGAIAADIHGKNHHVDGSISAHLEHLALATPVGRIECGPEERADVFAATCGGMGLTGVITEATLSLLPIETSAMVVDTERAPNLDTCMELLEAERGKFRYSVAWIDGLASGSRLGRAVLTRGDHALLGDLPARQQNEPLSYATHQLLSVPVAPPVSFLNFASVAAFNEMWFRKAPRSRRGEIVPIPGFFHPLDGVGRWNVLYGPRGFTQYQFVVPFGAEGAVRSVLERLSKARVASFLAVLKRFGEAGSGHLSFPKEGWTLALDIPLGASGIAELLDGLDTLIAAAGGRVYLAKDGRLRPELFETMYPRFREWSEIRDKLDPQGVLASDLGRRLHLGSGRVEGARR
jgi:decaprenylphospho-beta-D-ribofuranose 2-oxidase